MLLQIIIFLLWKCCSTACWIFNSDCEGLAARWRKHAARTVSEERSVDHAVFAGADKRQLRIATPGVWVAVVFARRTLVDERDFGASRMSRSRHSVSHETRFAGADKTIESA